MKVWIKLLSTYREYLPSDVQGAAYSVDVPAGARIEDLLAQVPVPADESQVILINGRTPLAAQVLDGGDVVAIFPAMAGG